MKGDISGDRDVQGRYEETSGNILLTLRSITQKPLQYFIDNKDMTKVRENLNVQPMYSSLPLLRLMKLMVLSSLQRRRKSTIQITRTSPTSKATGKKQNKNESLKKFFTGTDSPKMRRWG